jgi:hypothetical protein
MRRLALLALLALAALAVPALAVPDASVACMLSDGDDSVAMAAATRSGDGGVPAGFDGGDSGGTPADWDGDSSDASTLADEGTTGADDATTTCDDDDATGNVADDLTASAAGDATTGTQPPPLETLTVPAAEAAAAQAPAGGTGGGLPVTGVEVLQLALLGIALLLVGARLRVLALRRRGGSAGPALREADRAYEEDFAAPIRARRAERPAERHDWSFPDPDEPAPTGLLPSTASARRRARMLAAERD